MDFQCIGKNKLLLCENRCKRIVAEHRHGRWVTSGILAAMVLLAFNLRPLIGEDYQIDAVKEHQLSKIRTAIELQQTRMSTASRDRLAESIAHTSGKFALDPMLVLAVIQVESRFDHQAVSPSGAQGLMQVQPVAVSALVSEGKMPPLKRNIKDPPVNVEVGVSYLAYLKELFGDWKLALTAYNIGPSLVAKKIAAKQKLSFDYVRRVFSARRELNQQLAAIPDGRFANDDTISG